VSEQVFIVAVSGISGAGKSSVIKRTAALLGNASRLHFDDYKSVSEYPSDLAAWMEAGADLGAWRTPRLESDLRKLRSGEPIELPDGLGIVEPAAFILLEEPFGKARPETAQHIDFAAHLEVPADVLLARRVLRRLEEGPRLENGALSESLYQDLNLHLASRELHVLGDKTARRFADIVLDGMQSVDAIAERLVAEIHRRRAGNPGVASIR
jgi:uridine kinase